MQFEVSVCLLLVANKCEPGQTVRAQWHVTIVHFTTHALHQCLQDNETSCKRFTS